MKMKKALISVVLAVIFVFGAVTPAFAGLGSTYTAPIPTVYLPGQGFVLYADKDDTHSEQIQDVDIPDGYVGDAAKEMIGPLLKGVTLNQWDEWCDLLVEAVGTLYEKQALDENGEASNGSGVYTSSGKHNSVNPDGTYNIGAYTPIYDWRLDPCAIADEIRTYIVEVKNATKQSKVNLVGRSIGASVLLAYVTKYGMDDIETAVFYCPSFYGMEVFSRAFAGKVSIAPKAIDRFVDYYVSSGMGEAALGEENNDVLTVMNELVSATVALRALDLPAGALERIYEQVYTKVYPKLLVKAYGSMPSFWSLVGDEDYEEAKALIFGGQEDTYAGLIEKIDNFHYNVLNRAEDVITDFVREGKKVQIILKSGVPMVPVVEDTKYNSDMLTTVWSASAGATCAPIGETLSAEYRMEVSRKGGWKYLSPDNEIDASTGLLPDHTWYIDQLDHRSMPDSINVIFGAIFNYDGYMTVFDDENFPQYLVYDKDADELKVRGKTPEPEPQSRISAFFARIRNFFRALFSVLRGLFSKN